MRAFYTAVAGIFIASGMHLRAQSPTPTPGRSIEDFARDAQKLDEQAVDKIEPPLPIATPGRPFPGRYPWKSNIVTEVFWVGQPWSGTSSAWDPEWKRHYGGIDNPRPSARHNYIPIAFTPRQNPFYCELPYNDVNAGTTKPEAALVIPWFKAIYHKNGQSVCRSRWVEIRNQAGKTCYAQWSDCGPGGTDQWQYVFGNQIPAANSMHGAGLGVSPAVRDYLGLTELDVTSWRFVDYPDVPSGAWSNYGVNNDFLNSPRMHPNVEKVFGE